MMETFEHWVTFRAIVIGVVAAYGVWIALSRLWRRRKRNRLLDAGMDAELAGNLARSLLARELDAALAHWRDPDTVVQWTERGWFSLDRDGIIYFCRRLTPEEKLQRRGRRRFGWAGGD